MSVPHRKTPVGFNSLLRGWLNYLFMDDVRTSQEHTYGPPWPVRGIALFFICRSLSYLTGTHLWASMACYGYSFTFLYADHFRTSEKHTYGAPRPVTGIVLPFYMQMMFVPNRNHIFVPSRQVTGTALLFICR
jgi:hypothetical protein